MTDERVVSWKVLLPPGISSRLLAVGLNWAEVSGLARSWGDIHWVRRQQEIPLPDLSAAHLTGKIQLLQALPQDSYPYDVIVLGNRCRVKVSEFQAFRSLLTGNGILVLPHPCGRGTRKKPATAGFINQNTWAALPRKCPRILAPLSSGSVLKRALMFHAPGRPLARWILRLLMALGRIGAGGFLDRSAITLASPGSGLEQPDRLAPWLARTLARPVSDLLVYAGSVSPRRKLTILALAPEGHEDFVVKLADTEAGAQAIQQETRALQTMAETPLAHQTPRLLLEQRCWAGFQLQAQTVVAPGSFSQSALLSEHHWSFLAALSRVERQTRALNTTAPWLRIQNGLEKTTLLPPMIQQGVERILANGFSELAVASHRIHGDFAPWNIRMGKKGVFLVDWEESVANGLPFEDLFYFHYSIWRTTVWPDVESMMAQWCQGAKKLSCQADLPNGHLGEILLVGLLDKYLETPHPSLVAMVSATLSGQWKKWLTV